MNKKAIFESWSNMAVNSLHFVYNVLSTPFKQFKIT